MEKAIEMNIQGIKCDNKDCDYKKENVKAEDYKDWLDKPCPECGENLLTQADLDSVNLLQIAADLVNKIMPMTDDEEEKVTGTVEFDGTGSMNFKID